MHVLKCSQLKAIQVLELRALQVESEEDDVLQSEEDQAVIDEKDHMEIQSHLKHKANKAEVVEEMKQHISGLRQSASKKKAKRGPVGTGHLAC